MKDYNYTSYAPQQLNNSSINQEKTEELSLLDNLDSLSSDDDFNVKTSSCNCCMACFRLAKKVSLNKVETGIYHKGNNKFSSNTNTIGSMFALICIFIYLMYQLSSLTSVLSQNVYQNISGQIEMKDIVDLTPEMIPKEMMNKLHLSNHGAFPLSFWANGLQSCDDLEIFMFIIDIRTAAKDL